MNLINLLNGLTVRLVEMSYQFSPRRWISLTFVLYPTVGVAFQDTPDLMRGWRLQWHEDNGVEQESVVDAFLGKSVEEILTAVTQQWTAFLGGSTVDAQLQDLFNYVRSNT